MRGSAARALSVDRARRRRQSDWLRRGLKLNRVSHDGTLLADARGAALGPRTTIRSGWAESRRSRPRRRATTRSARTPAAPLAETLKLNGYSTAQFGKCHEVPVGETSRRGRSIPGRAGAEASSTSTVSSAAKRTSTTRAVRGHHAGRAGPDAGRGLPLHRGHDRQGDQLGPPTEGAHAGQAILRLLRPGATHAPHHVPAEWSAKYEGKFEPGLGHVAGGDVRAAEGTRVSLARGRTDGPT